MLVRSLTGVDLSTSSLNVKCVCGGKKGIPAGSGKYLIKVQIIGSRKIGEGRLCFGKCLGKEIKQAPESMKVVKRKINLRSR